MMLVAVGWGCDPFCRRQGNAAGTNIPTMYFLALRFALAEALACLCHFRRCALSGDRRWRGCVPGLGAVGVLRGGGDRPDYFWWLGYILQTFRALKYTKRW